ncbi:hypothetical protein QBC40DRAFT_260560 [Triangularia verruculosa]|uniref:Protein required for cell viability n=1 Tax=Triangularia verruculosa TaxID=2587418 RepID=A0AAN6XSC1_9PEZI|nr:hypothetical protein QBC40DRAFT_260560 [Triangularia verruculosa]
MDPVATEQRRNNARQKLMQSILDIGSKAFSPDIPESSRTEGRKEWDDAIQRIKAFNLIAALNILVRPGHAPAWLRPKLMEALTLIPLRPDGVRATMEFVFAVHPSSTVKVSEAAVPQKRGANITHEALDMASKLLSVPPSSVTPETWYSGIAPQLLVLLDGHEGPELTRTASYIIGFGILGRKASGAPGTAGWKHLAEPLLHAIKPPPNAQPLSTEEDDGIVDLSKERTLVKYQDLTAALRRLKSLVVSHPNQGLSKRLLSPLLPSLWTLSTWKGASAELTESISKPALELLKVYLKLAPSTELVLYLIKNMGYVGGYSQQSPEWIYRATAKDEVGIVEAQPRIGGVPSAGPQITMEEIDSKITKFLHLVTTTMSDADVIGAFLELLKRWFKAARRSKSGNVLIKEEFEETRDPLEQLIEIKTLQSMMEKVPDKLATQPRRILDLASEILASSADVSEDDIDEEVTGVALSLLNMIVTVPGFQKSRVDPDTLSLIENSLDKISKSRTDTGKTANNLRLLLLYRDEINDPSESLPSAPTDRQIEDRKTYSLAISYITAPDSPPPVRSEGLHLIGTLITSNSPVLDIPGILVLLSSLISDSDEYIYLRIIKLYTLLATSHPNAVTNELLDQFIDPKETHSVDARQRFAEALAQVIERLGKTFTGDLAQRVGDGLLSVAGRRARRAKTEARQARDAKLQERKNKEAADVWGGSVPDFSDPMTPEEKARNEILEKIVEGWESKRGSEDIRIRASALGVLGSAMEVNISGLGVRVVNTAVELCVSILQMERELETGILRRAAVMMILEFVKALDKEGGGRLGFGFGEKAREDVKRTLGWVRETDEDGLVRRHAGDLLESLENWGVRRLVVGSEEDEMKRAGGLGMLRGLVVNPVERVNPDVNAEVGGRPRIEEIE